MGDGNGFDDPQGNQPAKRQLDRHGGQQNAEYDFGNHHTRRLQPVGKFIALEGAGPATGPNAWPILGYRWPAQPAEGKGRSICRCHGQWATVMASTIPRETSPLSASWTATAVSRMPNMTSEITILAGFSRLANLSILVNTR